MIRPGCAGHAVEPAQINETPRGFFAHKTGRSRLAGNPFIGMGLEGRPERA